MSSASRYLVTVRLAISIFERFSISAIRWSDSGLAVSSFAMSLRIRSLTLSLAIASLGCAPIWVPVEQKTPRPFSFPTLEVKIELPVGWMSSYYVTARRRLSG